MWISRFRHIFENDANCKEQTINSERCNACRQYLTVLLRESSFFSCTEFDINQRRRSLACGSTEQKSIGFVEAKSAGKYYTMGVFIVDIFLAPLKVPVQTTGARQSNGWRTKKPPTETAILKTWFSRYELWISKRKEERK